MAFLANPWAVWIFFIIMAILIVIAIASASDNSIGSVIFAVAGIAIGFVWFYSATHRVVPANESWVYIDKNTGQPDGEIRSSGVVEKPFWQYSTKKYPGASEQPFCIDFYPATKEGYEVEAHICGTYDAFSLNWQEQFSLHNFSSEEDLLNYWTDQAKDSVRAVFKEVDYAKLNGNTIAVSNSLNENLKIWLAAQNVTAKNITLSNWKLTSPEVNKQIDAASAASMQSAVETQKLSAAVIARERQMYEVDTANLVLESRGTEFGSLFHTLGIVDDAAKAQVIDTMTWFSFAQNPPDGVTVIVGADAIAAP